MLTRPSLPFSNTVTAASIEADTLPRVGRRERHEQPVEYRKSVSQADGKDVANFVFGQSTSATKAFQLRSR